MSNKFANLDDDLMRAAMKKAISGFKASTGQEQNTGESGSTSQTTTKKQGYINPSKIDRVEEKLNYADRAIIPPVKKPTIPSNIVRQTPLLSEVQQYEDYYRQEQQRVQSNEKEKAKAKAKEAFESVVRHDLYGDPLVKKPDLRDKGVIALNDTGSASLGAGGPLAKNGARTRGYTDTASDIGAPIRFTGGTLKDIERKHNEAMARKDDTMDRFYATLSAHHIDRSKLSPEQVEIVEFVERELIKKSVLGTLTENERESIIDKTWKFLYNNTKSANGDPYPVFIDIAKTGGRAPYDAIINVAPQYDYSGGTFPEQIAMNTDILPDEALKSIFEYGRQKSTKSGEAEKYRQQFDYKNNVYLEEMENYFDALKNGDATPKDRQKYLDRALLKIYETCTKPMPVKDKRGNNAGTIPIGDLIAPYDDSFGAQVARQAMRLLGLGYKEQAGQGIYNKMEIDCSRLVNWSVAEVDEDLGINGISKSAGYQMAAIESTVWPTSNNPTLENTDMYPGDTLYWRGDETGKIVHTAIFIGTINDLPYMIEAGGTVQIVPVRENTTNNNGEDSTLVCVKRMTEEDLRKNADKNKR